MNDGPLGKRRVMLRELEPGQRPDRFQVPCRMQLEVLGKPGDTPCWLVYARGTVAGLVGVAAESYDFEALALNDPGFPEAVELLLSDDFKMTMTVHAP